MVEIHNGQIIGEDRAQDEELPSAAAGARSALSDLDPNDIAQEMARALSQRLEAEPRPTPMDLVNVLLQLKHPKTGRKLVWTLFDLYQQFAIWTRKMEGRTRI